ncbi:MAG TPA: SH3 domain-containing protein [Syntrophorhabdales bacterium]|nr:SH3 domain-containing protein [Syntrophorhabdales bacterium]
MRGSLYGFLFFLCTLLLFSCASAPYRTSVQLSPEPGKLALSQQDLDYAYNTAVSTGVDLGYRVVSSSVAQRMVTLNRLRSTDLVSETMEVSVESKGPAGDVNIVYQSPKPLEDITVKEFTDRFLAKLKARPSVQPASSAPGKVRVEPETSSFTGEQQGETHLILLKNSNIRTEPSRKGAVITTLRKGEKVIKLDESGDWFDVRLPSGGTGWISKRLVKEVK